MYVKKYICSDMVVFELQIFVTVAELISVTKQIVNRLVSGNAHVYVGYSLKSSLSMSSLGIKVFLYQIYLNLEQRLSRESVSDR